MASSREAALLQQVANLEQELAKERKEAAKERKEAANVKKQMQALVSSKAALEEDLVEEKNLKRHYRRQSEDVIRSTARQPAPLLAPLLARFKELYEQAAPDKPAGLTLEPAQAGALTGTLLHFLRIDGEAEVVGPLESVEEVSADAFSFLRRATLSASDSSTDKLFFPLISSLTSFSLR